MAVNPVLVAGVWAEDLQELGSFTGNVFTVTYVPGGGQPDLTQAVAIVGVFEFIFDPYGSVLNTDIVATYGGLPCQVAIQNIDPANGVYSGQNCTVVAVCMPAVTDTLTGNDFVLTVGGSTTVFAYLGAAWASLSTNVDRTVTDITSFAGANNTAVLAPADWSMEIPAQAGGAGDMLVTTMYMRVSAAPKLAIAAPYSVDNNFTTGSSTPLAAGRYVLPSAGSEVADYTFITPGTNQTFQSAWGLTFTLKALPTFVDVPDVTTLVLATAESDIIAASLTVGAVTTDFSDTIAAGHVISQNPVGGTSVAPGSSVDLVNSLGQGFIIPDVTLEPQAQAQDDIVAAGFAVGAESFTSSNVVPMGAVIVQNPAGGTEALAGTAVDLVISTGLPDLLVPLIIGLTTLDAQVTLNDAGLVPGIETDLPSDTVPKGIIISQSPVAGTAVDAGSAVNYTVSTGKQIIVPAGTFDFEATVISQYANSPTLLQLISNMNDYVRQDANFAAFFDFVWNVDTARGFGLNIWGKIVNISRLLTIPTDTITFGFKNSQVPLDDLPFNQGVFNSKGGHLTQTYLLPDDAYRTLILAKALANISATTAPAINQILQNLFMGRGTAYVLDLGNMQMQYTFLFPLSITEYAILAQSKALPRPAGVKAFIKVIPAASNLFGFAEASPDSKPFGFGTFYKPAG